MVKKVDPHDQEVSSTMGNRKKLFLYNIKDKIKKQQDITQKVQENIRNEIGCRGITGSIDCVLILLFDYW